MIPRKHITFIELCYDNSIMIKFFNPESFRHDIWGLFQKNVVLQQGVNCWQYQGSNSGLGYDHWRS